MMNGVPDTLEQQVIAIIAKKKKVEPGAITPATTFEELGIDSLDAADLLFTFEDTFGVVIPDDAAQTMRSVGQVIEGLRGLVAGAAGAP
jgi:acyl carrier protein